MTSTSTKYALLLPAAAFAFTLALSPLGAHAAEQCGFTRNLELDDEGPDVQCLQRYLNSAGYAIAASGIGSAGRETTQFKSLTEQAVANFGLPLQETGTRNDRAGVP